LQPDTGYHPLSACVFMYNKRLCDCTVAVLGCADIYVSCVSSTHCVANKGFYLALVATTVETGKPEQELKPGLDLLEPIKEK